MDLFSCASDFGALARQIAVSDLGLGTEFLVNARVAAGASGKCSLRSALKIQSVESRAANHKAPAIT